MKPMADSTRLELRSRDRFKTVREAELMSNRRLPRILFDAIIGGSGQSLTLRENTRAFDDVLLRPRSAMTYPKYELATKVLATEVSLPVLIAPTSMSRLIHPQGELAIARGAAASGTVCIIGWAASRTIEEIAGATTGPLWQTVAWRMGREGAEAIMDRASRAGYKALVVTIDLQTTTPPKIPRVNLTSMVQFAPQVVVRPRWLLNFIRDGMDTSKAVLPRPGVPTRWISPTWDDLAWIREQWRGGLVIKGVLSGEDARRAVHIGADAIVVSNHGGKGVDGVPATLRLLPEVVSAVGDQAEILMDGGIRRGSDVIKALALGAKAVLIGRPYLFGLAVGGAAGVHQVFEIFRAEMEETLINLGCSSVQDLDSSYLRLLPSWSIP
jgi:isopentenyl diphosphate isomerase/L-lactate dehydrogenase-like FMN-dependent dehydrogenase